jgi:hypothetical protein
VSAPAGRLLLLQVQAALQDSEQGSGVLVEVAHLKSYENMGQATFRWGQAASAGPAAQAPIAFTSSSP